MVRRIQTNIYSGPFFRRAGLFDSAIDDFNHIKCNAIVSINQFTSKLYRNICET